MDGEIRAMRCRRPDIWLETVFGGARTRSGDEKASSNAPSQKKRAFLSNERVLMFFNPNETLSIHSRESPSAVGAVQLECEKAENNTELCVQVA
jgi:hypothetical protein